MNRFVLLFIILCSILSFFLWNFTSSRYLSVVSGSHFKDLSIENDVFVDYKKQINHLYSIWNQFIISYSSLDTISANSYLSFLENGYQELMIISQQYKNLNQLSFFIPTGLPIQHFLGISSGFGIRLDPFVHKEFFHTGLDFIAPFGEVVLATATGKVLPSNSDKAYGTNIVLEHSYGFRTLYAHLHSVYKGVTIGKIVHKGEPIGYVGHTGRAKGDHLHYEILLNGLLLDPQDFIEWGKNLYSAKKILS